MTNSADPEIVCAIWTQQLEESQRLSVSYITFFFLYRLLPIAFVAAKFERAASWFIQQFVSISPVATQTR